MKQIKSKQGGLKAKRNGEAFENLIERSCIHYRRKGYGHIQKTPEPMKVIKPINRSRGMYQAIFTKKAQPDFQGTLPSGKSIVFEAKNTDSTNLAFDRINVEQEKELNCHSHFGAEVMIMISFNMKRFYAVPWTRWKWMKEHGKKKSVNERDLVDFSISINKGILDFLQRYD